MKITTTIIISFFIVLQAFAQGTTERAGRKKDSINAPYQYEYVFPILGQGAANKGFRIPKPHGIMLNILPMRQKLQLSNMQVGFNNSELINLEDIVAFEPMVVEGYTANFRFDTWVLPFLNVYGMIGALHSNTQVSLIKPIDLNVDVAIDGTYASLGAMVTGGFKNLFFSGDFSNSWTFTDKLDKPARVVLFGARMGPIFRLKNRPQSNIVLWGGVMYSNLISNTSGNIYANEVFPNLATDVAEVRTDLDEWYNNLSPIKQELYKDFYERVDNGLESIENFGDEGTIQYQMQKRIENPYNVVVGGQWQINPTWQLRTEGQFFGDRQAFLISVNYRFGIKGKNLFYNK